MSTEVSVRWRGLLVYGWYSHDRGCHTMANGDPGWPSTTDVDITSLELDCEPEEEPEILTDVVDYVGPAAGRLAAGWVRTFGTLPEPVIDETTHELF